MNEIKSVIVIGRTWFRKGPGTTVFSCCVYVNGEAKFTMRGNGGGSQYLYEAINAMADKGMLSKSNMEPPWSTAGRLGFKLAYESVEVSREKDLHY